ncbi:alpha-amylase family glycosyl hydrolase [Streptomyces shenzhenensis]|uniref:alpha-amylase family glycosyl hydrolase n=1 Tax=Streptomyces shenzhenensis TaxID=943815 RepID=UPI003D8EBB3B
MNVKPWWDGASVYHVYVRSFRDSDGDGHGDIRGIIEKLDYFDWLGIDGIWLSPTMPSPNYDWGYDVSDYTDVDPSLGTLSQLDELIREAAARNIRILLDLVPNHTSSEHPWFRSARSSKDSPYRDYYIWQDAKPDGGVPNNWLDDTGEVAWEWEETTGEYYFHNFMPQQPELNWRNPKVWDEFDRIMDFWFDRGVAGFRIDVANGLFKDPELRDNPRNDEVVPGVQPIPGGHGLQNLYNFNQPEVHQVYRHWRKRAEQRKDGVPLLLGETWVHHVDDLATYYGANDELQLAFNFPLIFAPFSPRDLADVVGRSLAAFPQGSAAIWAGSNHDLSRLGTRWAEGDQRRMRLAHTVLATLPGVYNLYYGDELGMADNDVPPHLHQDPLTAGGKNNQWPRDNARAAMRWNGSTDAGFSTGARTWLPLGEDPSLNVADERADDSSMLHYIRNLITLRRQFPSELSAYRQLHVDDTSWDYEVGQYRVYTNFSDRTREVPVEEDVVTSSAAKQKKVGPAEILRLEPWEAAITMVLGESPASHDG